MDRIIRITLLSLAALIVFGAGQAPAQQALEAGDQYLKGYLAYTQAERLEQGGDLQGAYQKFQEAQQQVSAVARSYPSYQPEVVGYRLKMIEIALQRLAGKAGPAAPVQPAYPTMPAPPPAMPNVPPAASTVPAPNYQLPPQTGSADPMTALGQQFRALQQQAAEAQSKLKLYEDGYTNALRERQKADQDRAILSQQLNDIKAQMDKLAKEGASNSAAVKDLEKYRNEAKMVAQMLALRDEQLKEKDQTIATLQGQAKTMEDRQKKMEEELALAKRDGNKPDDYKKLLAENTRLKKELDSANEQVTTLKAAGEKKDQEIASLRTQITAIQGDLVKLRKENTEYQTQVADLTVKLKEMNSDLEKAPKSKKKDLADNPRLAEENTMLRGIIMRELRHQERQRQAKELVIAEMKKMENSSQQLMDHLEEMTSARIRISTDEEKLFTQPEVKEIMAASGVRATMTADGSAGKEPAAAKDDSTDGKLAVQGDKAAAAGDMKAAEKSYTDALRANPRNVPVLMSLAALNLQAKKFDDAKVLLQKALAQDPENDVAYYRLGICQYQAGSMTEAMACFEKSVAKKNDNARAHHYLGIISSSLGNRHRAESEFKQALAIDPNYGDAHFNLAILYATGSPPDWTQARQHYKDALDRGIKADANLERILNKSETSSEIEKEASTAVR